MLFFYFHECSYDDKRPQYHWSTVGTASTNANKQSKNVDVWSHDSFFLTTGKLNVWLFCNGRNGRQSILSDSFPFSVMLGGKTNKQTDKQTKPTNKQQNK